MRSIEISDSMLLKYYEKYFGVSLDPIREHLKTVILRTPYDLKKAEVTVSDRLVAVIRDNVVIDIKER